MPRQEPGIRPARALPYALDVRCQVVPQSGTVRLNFSNTGAQGAVFQVRDDTETATPHFYTVEVGKTVEDDWGATEKGYYSLRIYGPNGFYRAVAGSVATGKPRLEVVSTTGSDNRTLLVTLSNEGTEAVIAMVTDHYNDQVGELILAPDTSRVLPFPVDITRGWYDLTIPLKTEPGFLLQLAGHLEDGHDSITDPAMGLLAGLSDHR